MSWGWQGTSLSVLCSTIGHEAAVLMLLGWYPKKAPPAQLLMLCQWWSQGELLSQEQDWRVPSLCFLKAEDSEITLTAFSQQINAVSFTVRLSHKHHAFSWGILLYIIPSRMGFSCKYCIWKKSDLLFLSGKSSKFYSRLCWLRQDPN